MSAPSRFQLSLLSEAVGHLSYDEFAPYLELKDLFVKKMDGYQQKFRSVFELFYGLNAGGLADTFKKRYFELLFGLRIQEGVDPYTPILRELYEIPRLKGDKALQCSFVSKLVAIHDETRPVYDRHVSAFFGITVPSVGSVDFRIAGFVANLEWLRTTYSCWSRDEQFQQVLRKLTTQYPSLKGCASPRLADLLVWTVGREKLGKAVKGSKV